MEESLSFGTHLTSETDSTVIASPLSADLLHSASHRIRQQTNPGSLLLLPARLYHLCLKQDNTSLLSLTSTQHLQLSSRLVFIRAFT